MKIEIYEYKMVEEPKTDTVTSEAPIWYKGEQPYTGSETETSYRGYSIVP